MACNLRRIINILGIEVFGKYLKVLVFNVFKILHAIQRIFVRFKQVEKIRNIIVNYFCNSLNSLNFSKNLIIDGGF